MKKVALLGAGFDTGNMGVGALTMGAIACVKQAWPDAEISLLEYSQSSNSFACRMNGGVVNVSLIAMRFSKKFYLYNNIALLLLLSILCRIIPSKAIASKIISRNAALKNFYETDLVLSIAGGDSFSDIYGHARFLYIVLPILWAIAMGRRLVIMPQTIGPFKSYFADWVAAFILRRSETVYARDNESLSLARKLMGPRHAARAHFCYDLGFILDPIKPEYYDLPLTKGVDIEKPIVGLNISGLLCIGGYTQKNMFGLRMDYSELIRSLIQYLIETKKTTVMLVPHVFGTSEESDIGAADRFYRELTERFGRDLVLVQGVFDQNEIKYIIGQCDFFIGSRMHACIAALSQCVPAIGIAYSRKFSGVMRSIEMDDLIADPRKSSLVEIQALIGSAMDQRADKAGQLRKSMPEIKNVVLDIFVHNVTNSHTAGKYT